MSTITKYERRGCRSSDIHPRHLSSAFRIFRLFNSFWKPDSELPLAPSIFLPGSRPARPARGGESHNSLPAVWPDPPLHLYYIACQKLATLHRLGDTALQTDSLQLLRSRPDFPDFLPCLPSPSFICQTYLELGAIGGYGFGKQAV